MHYRHYCFLVKEKGVVNSHITYVEVETFCLKVALREAADLFRYCYWIQPSLGQVTSKSYCLQLVDVADLPTNDYD